MNAGTQTPASDPTHYGDPISLLGGRFPVTGLSFRTAARLNAAAVFVPPGVLSYAIVFGGNPFYLALAYAAVATLGVGLFCRAAWGPLGVLRPGTFVMLAATFILVEALTMIGVFPIAAPSPYPPLEGTAPRIVVASAALILSSVSLLANFYELRRFTKADGA